MLSTILSGAVRWKTSQRLILNQDRRVSSRSSKDVQVTIVGAAGGIGQSLALLLKLSGVVSRIHLIDMEHAVGVASDLCHIDSPVLVRGFDGRETAPNALKGSDIVILTAGVHRTPSTHSRDDLFCANAGIVGRLVKSIVCSCPEALIGIIANPVNSLVPLAAELLRFYGRFDPKRLFGVTTLDLIRAKTFVAAAKKVDPRKVEVPVVGGHANNTIIPLLSQTKPTGLKFSDDEIKELTHNIQWAGEEIVKAKEDTGSATLSMAYAAARFTFSLCKALKGENTEEWAYVCSDLTESPYFSSKLKLSSGGIAENLGYGKLSDYEENLVKIAVAELKTSVAKGVEYVQQHEEYGNNVIQSPRN